MLVERFKHKHAEKSWRIDVSQRIRAYNVVENKKLGSTLDRKSSRSDRKTFLSMRKAYLEEEIYTYFYPFCMLNMPVCTAVIVRKQSIPFILFSMLSMAMYVNLIFGFPAEEFHFHKAALNYKSKKYS